MDGTDRNIGFNPHHSLPFDIDALNAAGASLPPLDRLGPVIPVNDILAALTRQLNHSQYLGSQPQAEDGEYAVFIICFALRWCVEPAPVGLHSLTLLPSAADNNYCHEYPEWEDWETQEHLEQQEAARRSAIFAPKSAPSPSMFHLSFIYVHH
jgi:hypothetical protein